MLNNVHLRIAHAQHVITTAQFKKHRIFRVVHFVALRSSSRRCDERERRLHVLIARFASRCECIAQLIKPLIQNDFLKSRRVLATRIHAHRRVAIVGGAIARPVLPEFLFTKYFLRSGVFFQSSTKKIGRERVRRSEIRSRGAPNKPRDHARGPL